MPDVADDSLVSVEEAARVLGLHPRQVRRYAEKLNPPDRTPDRTRPLRVKLEAVEQLRQATTQDQKRPIGHRTQDTGHHRTVLKVSETEVNLLRELLAEKDRSIEQLRARVDDLQRANEGKDKHISDLRRLLPAASEDRTLDRTEQPVSISLWRRLWWMISGQ